MKKHEKNTDIQEEKSNEHKIFYHSTYLMCDDRDARTVQVQPVGNLAICHNVHMPNPWSKPLQWTKGVSQFLFQYSKPSLFQGPFGNKVWLEEAIYAADFCWKHINTFVITISFSLPTLSHACAHPPTHGIIHTHSLTHTDILSFTHTHASTHPTQVGIHQLYTLQGFLHHKGLLELKHILTAYRN